MARLNIDDIYFIDPRRSKLVAAVGSEYLADGIMIRAWRLAQEYWAHEKREGVPLIVFQSIQFWDQIIASGLADQNGGRVYLMGTEERAEYRNKKVAAGRKGGLSKSKQKEAQPSKNEQIEASSSSSSSSSSKKKENTHTLSILEEEEKTKNVRVQNSIETKTKAPSREEVGLLVAEWQTTLDWYSIQLDAKRDEYVLARLAMRFGADDTLLMLRGFRRERASDDYDPSQNVNLTRLQNEKSRSRLRSLGAVKQIEPRQKEKIRPNAIRADK